MLSRRKALTIGAATLAMPFVARAQGVTEDVEIIDLVPPASVAPYDIFHLGVDWRWVTLGSSASTHRIHLHKKGEIVRARLHVIAHTWNPAYGFGTRLLIQDRSGLFYHTIAEEYIQPLLAQDAWIVTDEMEAERLIQIQDEAETNPLTDPQQGGGNPIGVQFRGVGRLSRCRLTIVHRVV